jgi:seryl-tRNA synthetase
MLDPKFIREHAKEVKDNLKKRNMPSEDVDRWIDLDEKFRKLKQEVDDLRHERNTASLKINELKKQGKEKDAQNVIKRIKELPEKIKDAEETLIIVETEAKKILMDIPNMLLKDVPAGKSAENNKVLKSVGKAPKFKFQPKDHLELLQNLNLIDMDRANKIAGAGFYYLKEELAILDMALQRFAIDFLRKKGFKLVEPPLMLHHKPYSGVTSLKAFEEVMYKIENEDLYLIATSEHAIASMFMDETLLEDELPIKLTGVSPCFRKEVGTHGKYTKGLFRMHQFNKVEQFIFCKPEDSAKYFNELQKNSEEMFRLLGIPYRTVLLCSADTGSVAAKTYDIEILMADKQYREVGSNSNCTDYQARRLNIKYKEKEGMAPKGFVHTLNNTGIATSRAMIAIIENNQQKDGSIKIPKVLQKYTGFKEIKAKKK